MKYTVKALDPQALLRRIDADVTPITLLQRNNVVPGLILDIFQ